jgi:hypothetical protein
LGLAANETPIILWQAKEIWFHFGGYAYEQVLLALLDNLRQWKKLSGIAVLGRLNQSDLQNVANNYRAIIKQIESSAPRLSFGLSLGKYHKFFHKDIQVKIILDLFDVDRFIDWLKSIKLIKIDRYHFLYEILLSVIQEP